MRRSLVLIAALASATCARTPQPLDIATTTSVVNSGLLDAILPQFHDSAVRIHAAGSGRSLAMLADGSAAFVIAHAPLAEQDALAQHPTWRPPLCNDHR